MLPVVRFGRTNLQITRLALGGYPFGGLNRARGWDPFTPEGQRARREGGGPWEEAGSGASS